MAATLGPLARSVVDAGGGTALVQVLRYGLIGSK